MADKKDYNKEFERLFNKYISLGYPKRTAAAMAQEECEKCVGSTAYRTEGK